MSLLSPNSVDVALHVYGKPLMTAVAISSLLEKSGKWINKIYLVPERQQPYNSDFKFIKNHFGDKVELYRPWFYNGLKRAREQFFFFDRYRWSVRYQYAFEKSTAKYLFMIHNDMLFHDDILELYLNQIQSGGFAGVGPIGMCWNCPASYAKLCSADSYDQYRPSENEINEIKEKYPAPRKEIYDYFRDGRELWPLPECRLNEWAALVDREQVAPYSWPLEKEVMFGQMDLDIAVRWFHFLNNKGLRFKNVPLDGYATHVWTGKEGEANSGVDTLSNKELYFRAEDQSFDMLVKKYGFTEQELRRYKMTLTQ